MIALKKQKEEFKTYLKILKNLRELLSERGVPLTTINPFFKNILMEEVCAARLHECTPEELYRLTPTLFTICKIKEDQKTDPATFFEKFKETYNAIVLVQGATQAGKTTFEEYVLKHYVPSMLDRDWICKNPPLKFFIQAMSDNDAETLLVNRIGDAAYHIKASTRNMLDSFQKVVNCLIMREGYKVQKFETLEDWKELLRKADRDPKIIGKVGGQILFSTSLVLVVDESHIAQKIGSKLHEFFKTLGCDPVAEPGLWSTGADDSKFKNPIHIFNVSATNTKLRIAFENCAQASFFPFLRGIGHVGLPELNDRGSLLDIKDTLPHAWTSKKLTSSALDENVDRMARYYEKISKDRKSGKTFVPKTGIFEDHPKEANMTTWAIHSESRFEDIRNREEILKGDIFEKVFFVETESDLAEVCQLVTELPESDKALVFIKYINGAKNNLRSFFVDDETKEIFTENSLICSLPALEQANVFVAIAIAASWQQSTTLNGYRMVDMFSDGADSAQRSHDNRTQWLVGRRTGYSPDKKRYLPRVHDSTVPIENEIKLEKEDYNLLMVPGMESPDYKLVPKTTPIPADALKRNLAYIPKSKLSGIDKGGILYSTEKSLNPDRRRILQEEVFHAATFFGEIDSHELSCGEILFKNGIGAESYSELNRAHEILAHIGERDFVYPSYLKGDPTALVFAYDLEQIEKKHSKKFFDDILEHLNTQADSTCKIERDGIVFAIATPGDLLERKEPIVSVDPKIKGRKPKLFAQSHATIN
tara:strand:+ start:111 stop:2399 length:2289 start_codon:yes stop_codon:yes gene_type:complete